MRQFWIKNSKGQTFDMNREDAFFSDPKGLGISRKTTYEQVGYSWLEKENILSQKKPYGNMIFDGYEQYDEFINIVQYTPLILMYQPLDTMYYMDVNTFTIDKSEISNEDTFLTCKVTFEGSSPWYKKRTISRNVIDSAGKNYSYAYPYTYSDLQSGKAELKNESGIEAYCRLKLYGPLTNPSWKLSQNNVLISEGKVIATIGSGSCLIVDSDPTKMEISEYDLLETFVSSLYEKSDFSTNRFIYVPVGKSTLKITHEGPGEVRYAAEVIEFVG